MARLPILASLAAASMLGYAGYLFWQDLQTDRPQPDFELASSTTPAETTATAPSTSPTQPWPPVFGEPQPPSPQAAPPAQEASAAQPAPPLSGMGYSLVGLFESEAGKWAIIAHPTGSALVREGDTLAPGLTVAEITAEGIWFGEDPSRQFLAFPE